VTTTSLRSTATRRNQFNLTRGSREDQENQHPWATDAITEDEWSAAPAAHPGWFTWFSKNQYSRQSFKRPRRGGLPSALCERYLEFNIDSKTRLITPPPRDIYRTTDQLKMTPKRNCSALRSRVFDSPDAAKVAGFVLTEVPNRETFGISERCQRDGLKLVEKKCDEN